MSGICALHNLSTCLGQTEPLGVLGVDLGIVNLATDSDGEMFSGEACSELFVTATICGGTACRQLEPRTADGVCEGSAGQGAALSERHKPRHQ